MTVLYNGVKIEVIPQYDADDNLILFKGKDRNYNLSEVIYDGCPQIKNK